MGDEKASTVMGNRERDRELLIPVAGDPAAEADSKASSPVSTSTMQNNRHHHSGRDVTVVRSEILWLQ
ncbi:hypothetical protein MA16_Dca028660 [Dendrobium catenatum]|uniref:Uncharacterized protein n=1 Tax=Dendrobium catenatum TaxID=906689 RepID=A0A2I0VB12_9ASPA|nr:hypothetical protein MA16_Dca028660 [Dendrobium catenatum]